MTAPIAERTWEPLRDAAARRGWTAERTPGGHTCCTKRGSVVFGPGSGGDYRELLGRLARVDRYAARWRP